MLGLPHKLESTPPPPPHQTLAASNTRRIISMMHANAFLFFPPSSFFTPGGNYSFASYYFNKINLRQPIIDNQRRLQSVNQEK